MNTRRASGIARRAAAACVLCAAVGTAAAQSPAAPVLSPPIAGSGAGYHDPRSAFKPLQEREGVVSWALLSSVTAKTEKNKIVPVFPPAVQALNNKPVKVQGFMLPLEPGERQFHFLLSAVPTTCSFCVPAGPEGLIEVRTSTPVKYTVDAITVQGRMAVLRDDKYGLFYRVVDAVPAP
jgi:uncharacterized protein